MKNRFRGLAFCLGCWMAGAASADGVTRSVEPVAGGCRVTLAWEFSGKAESDLVIEERLAPGWTVDGATVPFGSLDASWLSGRTARFAVKPALLAQAGSIAFTVVPGEGAVAGVAAGDWKMYLGGSLRKGVVSGSGELALATRKAATGTSGAAGTEGTTIAIRTFKLVGTTIELSYSGAPQAGTLAVEGCEAFDKPWSVLTRVAVSAGDGKVALGLGEAGGCRFFRLKFVAEE